jgi:hypothetical protein
MLAYPDQGFLPQGRGAERGCHRSHLVATFTAARGTGPLWVKRVDFVMSAICPVYPKQQTFPDSAGTSHLCQQRTLASAAESGHSAFAIGLFNRRGVTARMPTDVGGQERDEAAKYRRDAKPSACAALGVGLHASVCA